MIVRASALRADGFTYGDWRQFVAFLDNGQAVCCRMARWPLVLASIGLLFIMAGTMGVAGAEGQQLQIEWPRAAATLFVGFACLGPAALFRLTVWRCVVAVGPVMDQLPDGGYRRRFHGEA